LQTENSPQVHQRSSTLFEGIIDLIGVLFNKQPLSDPPTLKQHVSVPDPAYEVIPDGNRSLLTP